MIRLSERVQENIIRLIECVQENIIRHIFSRLSARGGLTASLFAHKVYVS